MSKLRVLSLGGSYYEMGYQHGKTYHDAIHHFTQDRLQLSRTEMWTGRELSPEAVLALAEACVPEHERYSPQLTEELRGMSDATGLSLAELIVNNGFTDFIDTVYNVGDLRRQSSPTPEAADNCTAFLVPPARTADGKPLFGQTWDMHATATPYVILMHATPDDAPPFLNFTITGCVGMIGMNAAGITVGINNIMATDGQVGVTWNFVVRKILMQDNLDDALACITEVKLAGAHNYLLMDRDGNGYNVEAMPTRHHIEKLESDALIHTNHCLTPRNHDVERVRPEEAQANSEKRYSRAHELLNRHDLTPEDLEAITRDDDAICVRAKPPRYVESCGAAIMSPATGEFRAVWGLPSENEYEHFTI